MLGCCARGEGRYRHSRRAPVPQLGESGRELEIGGLADTACVGFVVGGLGLLA